MIDLKEIEKMIMDFGLSMREAKVYITLFQKKDFTAAEIQQLVNIPRTKVYEVMQLLISKGLCVEIKIGRLKKYQASKPESSFNGLLHQYKEDVSAKENIADNVIKILSPIFEQIKGKDNPLDYIEVIRDSQQIHEKFMSNIELTNYELLAFTKAPYSVPYIVDHDKEIKALKRGVKFKSVYEYQDAAKQELVEVIDIWVSAGEEARVIKELPMKMIIFDDKITMFSLVDPISLKPSLTTLVINHPSFTKALKYVFESIWEKAMPYEEFKKLNNKL